MDKKVIDNNFLNLPGSITVRSNRDAINQIKRQKSFAKIQR